MTRLDWMTRGAIAVAVISCAVAAGRGRGEDAPAEVPGRWGELTAPTFGTSEGGAYVDAELFAGPSKFGADYFAGVLPSGRFVKPAGTSVQVGMNPLGIALTPDGRYLVTSNDDERDGGIHSLRSAANVGGYSLSVVDTATMGVVSTVTTGTYFVGVAIKGAGTYTVYASGGASQDVKEFSLSAAGQLSAAPVATIPIPVITPASAGFVSHYTPDAALNTADASGNKPPVPSGFSRTGSTAISFPAGLALSPDGRYLYVACNGDNSVAVVQTATRTTVKQLPVGYFPYGVAVSADGATVYVTNWGVTEYRFRSPTYDPASGKLTAIAPAPGNAPDGYYVPAIDTAGPLPKTSSAWVISIPDGDPAGATVVGARHLGRALDDLEQVGDTHPSATALVGRGSNTHLYVARANDDTIAVLDTAGRHVSELDLALRAGKGHGAARVLGTYPNALAVSPDGTRVYVAEAGINAVAVLDTSHPQAPRLLGRIPTGWYPTAVAVGPDGNTLYVANAKGVGEDVNPNTGTIESFTDGNFIFGTVQKIDLAAAQPDERTVLANNFTRQRDLDTNVVPAGGQPSRHIKHVIFILHENKTFDSMLGGSAHFGPYASTTFANANGAPNPNPPPPAQYNSVSFNTTAIAEKFATAVNYYSDSEESDAGHQFAASGTASDYTEKTLLVKGGRGLLVNKNFEPEDYPASGYIFNNAARHGVSFKDYGAFVRIAGTDTGTSTPTTIDDPASGSAGYPASATANDPHDVGDTTSAVQGLGQAYFLSLPALAVLGKANANGEPRIDANYPGYNFNVSDQRRAREFIADFDRMVAAGTLPQFLYVYQPNDHTGSQQAKNVPAASPAQQVADGDVALGMVVQHIMKSPIYYDAATDTGAAIFITYDDAQSTLDHIHEHRTPLVVVSPFAKPGYVAKRHYDTASVVKTEELLLGLPPNNLGDLLATDLRDLFQPTHNGIAPADVSFSTTIAYRPSAEGKAIWALAKRLDLSGPDRDSRRLGALARMSMQADRLHFEAAHAKKLRSARYRAAQKELLAQARALVGTRESAQD